MNPHPDAPAPPLSTGPGGIFPPAPRGHSPHSMKSSTQARVATITSRVSPMLCHMLPARPPRGGQLRGLAEPGGAPRELAAAASPPAAPRSRGGAGPEGRAGLTGSPSSAPAGARRPLRGADYKSQRAPRPAACPRRGMVSLRQRL